MANQKLIYNFTGQSEEFVSLFLPSALTLIAGTAIYLSVARTHTSGQYAVALDSLTPVIVDGFTDSLNAKCEIGWSAFGLKDEPHTIVITTKGQSPQAAADGGTASTFELDGIM